jgi:hypothetical protein
MSAEGILDNPALFLPQIGSREEAHINITINDPSPLLKCDKREKELRKRLRKIEKLEAKVESQGENSINEEE